MKLSFLDGIAKALGLGLPTACVGIFLLYRQQHLTTAQHLMVLNIVLLALFGFLGYFIFRSQRLFLLVGQQALLCFALWALSVVITRTLTFFNLISADEVRWTNTGSALFFTWVLSWRVWGHTGSLWLKRIFGPEHAKETP